MNEWLPLSGALAATISMLCWVVLRYPNQAEHSDASSSLGAQGIHSLSKVHPRHDLSDLGYEPHQHAASGYRHFKKTAVHTALRAANVTEDVPHSGEKQGSLADSLDWVALYLMAPEGHPFGGYELFQALTSLNLRHGDDYVFRYYHQHHQQPVCLMTVANALKPGTLMLESAGQLETPCLLLLFEVTQVPCDVPAAFEVFVAKAYQLAEELDATLCHTDRQPVRPALLQALRDQFLAVANCEA